MNHGALMATLGRRSPWRFLSAFGQQYLLGLIGEMVGQDRPGVFTGCAGSLAAVGCGRHLQKARQTQSACVFRGEVGSLASLACKPLVGKLVRFTVSETILDDSAVAVGGDAWRRTAMNGDAQ